MGWMALAGVAALAQPTAAASPWDPLAAPVADSAGRVAWTRVGRPGPETKIGLEVARASDDRLTAAERARAWRSITGNPSLRPYALRRLAALHLASGDSTRADSCLAELVSAPGIWTWEALRARADLALARRDRARADSLLAAADTTHWPDVEKAEWLERRSRVAADRGDTALAIRLCRRAIGVHPAQPSAAASVLRLESLRKARGEPLTVEEEVEAAEVEVFGSRRDAAAARLRRAFERATEGRWRIGLRLAQVLRQRRWFREGLRVLATSIPLAPTDAERAHCMLERARNHRAARRPDSAYVGYAEAAKATADASLRETAWWESAEEAEQNVSWRRARRAYRRVIEVGGSRAGEAALRLGLLWLAEGARDSALAAWEGVGSEGAAFWRAIVVGARDRAAADSALRDLAARPGYDFYRAMARDTLGVRGWPGGVTRDSCPDDSAGAAIAVARDLVLAGARDEAVRVLRRWAAGDGRLPGSPRRPVTRDPRLMLAASRIAGAAGFVPGAIQWAAQAGAIASRQSPELHWGTIPWVYPAALDSLYAAFPEERTDELLERSLVQAVTWQESRFDPDARSRSNAIGLLQLMLPTASDVARWFRDPPPTEGTLRDPGTSIRYGSAYLEWLLDRFEGRLATALAAYNAGPGRIPGAWREYVERGGEALLCELVVYPETRDYVKRVLGALQAYRELRPFARTR